MAVRRDFRSRLGDLADSLLRSHLTDVENEKQQERELYRQQALASAESDNVLFNKILSDPSGKIAQSVMKVRPTMHGINLADLAPGQADIQAPVMKTITDAKTRADLPSPEGVITGLAAADQRAGQPGITNLADITPVLNAYVGQQNKIGSDEAAAIKNEGAKAYSVASNTGQANNDVADANLPDFLWRKGEEGSLDNNLKLAYEKSLSPVLAGRHATELGQNLGFERSMGPIRAQQAQDNAHGAALGTETAQMENPLWTPLTKAVVANPDMLDKLPAADRAQVMANFNSETFKTERQKAQQEILRQALQAFNHLSVEPGFEGAVGQSFQKLGGLKETPFVGTQAIGYKKFFDQFKASMTLPKLELVRGLGRLNQREWQAFQDAATALDLGMPEDQFTKLASQLRPELEQMYKNAGGNPADLAGAQANPLNQFDELMNGRTKRF